MILQPIDRNEALRYLGCKDGTDNEQMLAMLDSCEKQLLKAASPKQRYSKKYTRTAVHGDILPATVICPLIYSLIY